MSVIRSENRVPEAYVNMSRDFQLLCRLFNVVNNGILFNAESIKNINNPRRCMECYLNLLADKYGFEYTSDIKPEQFRIILCAFKRIVMYKGSIKGIEEACNCFANATNKSFKYSVLMDYNKNIYIYIYSGDIFDIEILRDILKYVIPAGCMLNIIFTVLAPNLDSDYNLSNMLNATWMNVTNSVPNTKIGGGKVLIANGETYANYINTAQIGDEMIINSASLSQVSNYEDRFADDNITTAAYGKAISNERRENNE